MRCCLGAVLLVLVSACTETETRDVACSASAASPDPIDISEGATIEIFMVCESPVDPDDVSCQHIAPGELLANGQVIYIPLEASASAEGNIVLRGDMPPGYLDVTAPTTIEAGIDCGLEWNTVATVTWQVVP